MKNRPVYEKHNSFVEIRHQHKNALAAAMKRIAGVRNRDDLVEKMSEVHQRVFSQACKDLLDPDPQDKQPDFPLVPV